MIVTKTYVQEGYEPPKDSYLPKELYQKVLRVWPKPCVDAVLYYRTGDATYMVLGKRKIQPIMDWWIFGGKVFSTDESLQAAMCRKLKEEIGLDVAIERIPKPFRQHMYKWADDGSVCIADTFLVEITHQEYLQMRDNLSKSLEYSGLAALPPSQIVAEESYHPAVRDCAVALL